jgi:hypothetical protein
MRADQGRHPRAHLPGGLVGEGDRQQALRPDAMALDQVRDAGRQDPRLAAAGAGEDQQRTVTVLDRLPLGRVQPSQHPLQSGVLELRLGHQASEFIEPRKGSGFRRRRL